MLNHYGKTYLVFFIFIIVCIWCCLLVSASDIDLNDIQINEIIVILLGVLSGTHSCVSYKKSFFIGYNRFGKGIYKIKKDDKPSLFLFMVCLYAVLSIGLIYFGINEIVTSKSSLPANK